MQVIPNQPHPESTGSERLVLKLLRGVDWGRSARALNSLNLADHVYQRWGEIDFLVVGPRGLIVIEVKGGSVSCSNGIWSYQDRLGRIVRRSKSPVVQAKDAYFSLLQNYVAPRMGDSFGTDVPTGFCVILAGATKGELSGLLGGPELPREITGTKEDISNVATLGAFLERVASYWRGKAHSAPSMSERDVARLISLLRPEFEMVRPLALSRDRAAQDLLKLTEEQYEVLDHWAGADRVLCSSPAGCGKTLLAVEILRREVAGGVNCLFVSGTQQLAEVVREGCDVATRVLSIQELEAMPREGRPVADVVVVDEGQQLLTSSHMAILEGVIAGGIKNGRWAWFGDPNYQLPGNRADAQGFLEVLQAAASVQPRLRRNCRNTPEIVTMAELASGISIGHAAAKGRGAMPVILGLDEPNEMAIAIGRQVQEWLSQDIPPGEVCLLVEGGDAARLAGEASRTGGFDVRPWEAKGTGQGVVYASVETFRGLESPFIILCIERFDGIDDEFSRLLYLAMTRANFALTILGPKTEIARIGDFVEASARSTGG